MATARDSKPTLHDLVFRHSGFVKSPLQWTSRHLDLVGCRFEDLNMTPPNASTQGDSKDQKSGSAQLQREVEMLGRHFLYAQKRQSLVNILIGKDYVFASYRKGPSFYFQGRPVHRPEYTMFNRHEQSLQSSTSPPPSIGYMHYSSVNGDRRKQFEPRPGPRGIKNTIGMRICMKKLDQMTPKDWTADPYFLCHLLALAQTQQHEFGLLGPSSYTSRLLITNVHDQESILLCEAEIPIEVLEGLKSPKVATNSIIWPIIHRKQILYKPHSSFAQRLVAELIAVPMSNNGMLKHDMCPDSRINGTPDGKRRVSKYKEIDQQERQKLLRHQ